MIAPQFEHIGEMNLDHDFFQVSKIKWRPKKIALIKMFISSKLFVLHLPVCQTQSFEDMNILIKAILKFCTTNQLLKKGLHLKWNTFFPELK